MRAAYAVAGLAVSGAALAGCGAASSSSAPPPTVTGSAAGGSTVAVSETQFHLALSTDTVTAGPVTFQVRNDGSIKHALTVQTAQGERSTKDLSPGESATLTVTLSPGKTEIWCPVGDHRMEGMDTTVTVA